MAVTIPLAPLTAEAFASWGEVLAVPAEAGRVYYDAMLANLRPGAHPSLSIARIDTAATLPVTSTVMERHPHSSQSFVPLAVDRYVVVVAPEAADGGPDMGRAIGFLAGPDAGITYRAGVWHHPMTVTGGPATFAIVMWNDGGAEDTVFATLAEPVTIGG